MPRKPPRRIERERAHGRCSCLAGHVEGLARSNRKNAGGLYFTEPGNAVAKHFSDCPHSLLAATTGLGSVPKRPKKPRKRLPRSVT